MFKFRVTFGMARQKQLPLAQTQEGVTKKIYYEQRLVLCDFLRGAAAVNKPSDGRSHIDG